MATRAVVPVAAVMVAVLMLVASPSVEGRSKAAAGTAPATVLCNMTEDGLLACKPAVTKPNPADPSPECCTALSTADLTCLCSYKKSAMLPALGIDPDLAIGLPPKCNMVSPPNCAGSKP